MLEQEALQTGRAPVIWSACLAELPLSVEPLLQARRKEEEENVLVGPVLPDGEGGHAAPGSYGGAMASPCGRARAKPWQPMCRAASASPAEERCAHLA